MASRMKDWRARADWETLIFLAGGAAAALDRFGGSRRSCPAELPPRSLLAGGKLDAFCLDGARNPAHFWMGALAKAIALYLYGTNMKLCVRLGEPVGQMMGQPFFLHGA